MAIGHVHVFSPYVSYTTFLHAHLPTKQSECHKSLLHDEKLSSSPTLLQLDRFWCLDFSTIFGHGNVSTANGSENDSLASPIPVASADLFLTAQTASLQAYKCSHRNVPHTMLSLPQIYVPFSILL
jgi:hypothetical protein